MPGNGNGSRRSGYSYLKDKVTELEGVIRARDEEIMDLEKEIVKLRREVLKVKGEGEVAALERALKDAKRRAK